MNRGPIRGQTQCRPDGQTGMLFPACSLALRLWRNMDVAGDCRVRLNHHPSVATCRCGLKERFGRCPTTRSVLIHGRLCD